MNIKWTSLTMAALVGLVLCGCDQQGRKQSKGFRLPDGSVENGQKAFVELKCHTCHSVSGVELPKPDSPGKHNVALGGDVVKVKTYGQLVTAVIHPAHDITKGYDATFNPGEEPGSLSPMPDYNNSMTVQQVIDMVAFLHSRYKLRQIDYEFHAH